MTTPSERQKRDLKAVEAEIANWHRVIGRFGSSTDVEKHQLTKLERERARLLQSSGGEVPPIPLMCSECKKWSFSGSPPLCERKNCPGPWSTPAEPNPPGSGEPVAWRYKPTATAGLWALTDERSVADVRRQNKWYVEPLYAAPLSSPSEGAGLLEAAPSTSVGLVKAAREATPEQIEAAHQCVPIRRSWIREIINAALRTRATATGGGGNG